MKYKSQRGTIINIPDGLSAKQIAAIKADADSGYGTRAQQTANQLGKKLSKGGDRKTDGTDYFDDSGKIKDSDQVVNNLTPTPSMDQFLPMIQQAQKGAYDYLTRNYESDKTRELELAKQELANRGIPYNPAATYDPNSQDLYGRTIGGINRSWQDKYDQASNQSYTSALDQGTAAYNAAVGAAGQSNDAFLTAILGLSDAELQRYGINKDFIIKQKALNKPTGGGSGGGQASGGFEIV